MAIVDEGVIKEFMKIIIPIVFNCAVEFSGFFFLWWISM